MTNDVIAVTTVIGGTGVTAVTGETGGDVAGMTGVTGVTSDVFTVTSDVFADKIAVKVKDIAAQSVFNSIEKPRPF